MEMKTAGWGSLFTSFMLASAIFVIFGICLTLVPDVKRQLKYGVETMELIRNTPGIEEKGLVFLPGKFNILNRNYPFMDESKNVYALYLTPEVNEKVLENFPDRKPFFFTSNPRGEGFILTPRFDNTKRAANYYAAAESYLQGLEDIENGKKAIKKALELDPDNPVFLMFLADVYVAANDFQKTYDTCEQVLKLDDPRKGPHIERAVYMMGRSKGELGEYREAVEIFTFMIQNLPNTPLTTSARQWAAHYSKMQN